VSAAALVYPFGAPPESGGAVPLGFGVTWLRLPVPGGLKHINLWLLEDGAGYTLVDTGMNVPAARAAWEGPLAAVLGGRPITRLICTHHHPDHAGLAGWLVARHAMPVYMSAPEEQLLRGLLGSGPERDVVLARTAKFQRAGLGAGGGGSDAGAGLGSYRRVMSGIPPEIRRIAGGEALSIGGVRWVAHQVRGHTDGQLVLHAPDAGLLISADQVLPRITSNVGIYPEREDADPLASFLGSFADLAAIDPEPMVLPSHGDVFRGLRARLAELKAHHERTLEQVEGLVTAPTTAAELAGRLFRSALDPLNRMLAIGETLAHLHYLAARGRLALLEEPGAPRRYGPAVGR
jgi:glyoxylase-like metal-dependent hydrolase (beta-lactamase superfamily II)